MLVLKGENGKSKVIGAILEETNSICFVYNDYALFEDSIWLDSRMYTLEHLKLCITQEIVRFKEDYDYLIIYTNQTENYLKYFIDWLNDYQPTSCVYRNIIVTCK